MEAATPEAVRLLLEGSLTFARIERNGIRIDTDYLRRADAEMTEKIRDGEARLRADPVYKVWKRTFGDNANLGSKAQLGVVLYDKLGIVPTGFTEKTGKPSTDKAALAKIDLDFAREYLKVEKYRGIQGKFLKGIAAEVVDGYLHPHLNLHTVVSYRSSGSDPNPQNWPSRDPEMMRAIKRCFIPRPGNIACEIDFKGAEVRVSCCVAGHTLVETIDGPQPIARVCRRVNAGEDVYVYGYNMEKKRVAVSKVTEGGITKSLADVVEVVLDNGESVITTPDHKFLTRTGEYVEARELKAGVSLMPFQKKVKKSPWGTNYSKIYLNNGSSMLAHNLIALDVHGVTIAGSDLVVHHKNGKGTDNSLINLEIMDRSRHMSIHSKQGWEGSQEDSSRYEWRGTEANRERMREMNRKRKEEWTDKDWEEFRWRVSEGIRRKGGNGGSKNPMYGKKQSAETRKKISDAKKGVKLGKAWNTGHTKETHPSVAKISRSKVGQPSSRKGVKIGPMSEEQKKKISKTLTGRKYTEEHKKKISARLKSRWENIKKHPPKKQCPLCGKVFISLGSHLRCKHKADNHKVVSVKKYGSVPVYNITVDGIHNYAVSAGVIIKNCYHRDPQMIKEFTGKDGDPHGDTARELFGLEKDQVDKKSTRDWSKNRWVFPQFYGSVYFQCAPHLWEVASDDKFKLPGTDVSVRQHLEKQGITRLGDCDPRKRPQPGTFEYRCQQVERSFWEDRFRVYNAWKKKTWAQYQRDGFIRTLTGFVCRWGKGGPLARNDALNYGIQGSSFHCLLKTLILLQNWLLKHRMKSKIVNQIHDSLWIDMVPSERDDILAYVKWVVTKGLMKVWDWITVPLDVEAEMTPEPDMSWVEKKAYPM